MSIKNARRDGTGKPIVESMLIALVAGVTWCVLGGMAFAADAPGQSRIGYATVADALADLKSRPSNQVSVQGGWVVVSDREHSTLWSFVPKDNPAFPAVVKRTIVQKVGSVYIDMTALCQAPKKACDELIGSFKVLNEELRQSLLRGKAKS